MALHPWEQKTVEHLTIEEVVAWVEWYATQRTGPVVFDADTVAHGVLLWGETHRGQCKDCKMWEVGDGYFCIGLLMQINELKGFAPITIVDIAPHRTHSWEVLPCETLAAAQQMVGDCAEGDLVQYKYLGMHDSHRGKKYYVLSWVGREPGAELVRNKMKQHGARFE